MPAMGVSAPSGGGTNVGNPYLGASYFIDGDAVRLTFGLGFTIPVADAAQVGGGIGADLPNAGVIVSRMEGGVRPWLFLPQTFAIVGRGRVESVGPWLLAADLAVAPMIPVDSRGVYDGHAELVLIPAAELGWRASPWLTFGVRGQVSVVPTQTDETLGSLEPFIEAKKRDIGHFRVGFVVHLGGPNGATFDTNGLWALRLTAGMLF